MEKKHTLSFCERGSLVAPLLTAEQHGGEDVGTTSTPAYRQVHQFDFFHHRGPTRNPGSSDSSGEPAQAFWLLVQIELGKKSLPLAAMSSVPRACNFLSDCAAQRISKYMAQSGKLQKTRARKTVVIICLKRQIQSLIRGDSEDLRYLDCQPAVSM